MLVELGRLMSAFMRRRTTLALDAVNALQVRMVNLVRPCVRQHRICTYCGYGAVVASQ